MISERFWQIGNTHILLKVSGQWQLGMSMHASDDNLHRQYRLGFLTLYTVQLGGGRDWLEKRLRSREEYEADLKSREPRELVRPGFPPSVTASSNSKVRF